MGYTTVTHESSFRQLASDFRNTTVVCPILALSGISIPMNLLVELITGRLLRDKKEGVPSPLQCHEDRR